ncbi:hypothetical protein EMIT0196P_150114 [Pseudomonas chlororaphis]
MAYKSSSVIVIYSAKCFLYIKCDFHFNLLS